MTLTFSMQILTGMSLYPWSVRTRFNGTPAGFTLTRLNASLVSKSFPHPAKESLSTAGALLVTYRQLVNQARFRVPDAAFVLSRTQGQRSALFASSLN